MFNQGFGRQENNTAYSIVAEGDVVICHKVDHYQYKNRKEGFVIYHDLVQLKYKFRKEGFVIYHDVVHYQYKYRK